MLIDQLVYWGWRAFCCVLSMSKLHKLDLSQHNTLNKLYWVRQDSYLSVRIFLNRRCQRQCVLRKFVKIIISGLAISTASLASGLWTGSGRLFQAGRPAMAAGITVLFCCYRTNGIKVTTKWRLFCLQRSGVTHLKTTSWMSVRTIPTLWRNSRRKCHCSCGLWPPSPASPAPYREKLRCTWTTWPIRETTVSWSKCSHSGDRMHKILCNECPPLGLLTQLTTFLLLWPPNWNNWEKNWRWRQNKERWNSKTEKYWSYIQYRNRLKVFTNWGVVYPPWNFLGAKSITKLKYRMSAHVPICCRLNLWVEYPVFKGSASFHHREGILMNHY